MNTTVKAVAVGVFASLLSIGHTQPSQISTNRFAHGAPLYIPARTKGVPVSYAIKVASALRAGMNESDAADFLKRNGINSFLVGTNGMTNQYSLSVGSASGWTTSYPLASGCSLDLYMRATHLTSNGWSKDGVLERAYIYREGSNIFSILLTNAP